MSLLCTLLVATEPVASRESALANLQPSETAKFTSVTVLEFSTLWAISEAREWNVEMMDEFVLVAGTEDPLAATYRLPEAFVRRMAVLDDAQIDRCAQKWGDTEEMACDSSDTETIVRALSGLSQLALTTGRKLYFWNAE